MYPEQLGFEQEDPLTVKGYVAQWEKSNHHLKMLRAGYVPYHWRDTRSFDTAEYGAKKGQKKKKMNNAKGAMNRMAELSQAGGEAAISAGDHDNVFVGVVSPGCLWTGNVAFPSGTMTMKGFRFDRVAEVEPGESTLADEVINSVGKYNRGTLGNAKTDQDIIRDLIRQLEGSGRL